MDGRCQRLTRTQANKLKVAQLREKLAALGKETEGLKPALVDRLIGALEEEHSPPVKRAKDDTNIGSKTKRCEHDDGQDTLPAKKKRSSARRNAIVESEDAMDVVAAAVGNASLTEAANATENPAEDAERLEERAKPLARASTYGDESGSGLAHSLLGRHDPPTHTCTILVRNMSMRDKTPMEVVDSLRWLLTYYGNVVDVDLVKDEGDGGYGDAATITMSSEHEANAAVAALHARYSTDGGGSYWSLERITNGVDIDVGAASSLNRGGHSTGAVRGGTQTQRHHRAPSGSTLFVSNTLRMDDDSLAALFGKLGNLREAKLFRDDDGTSRGIALVRYHDHASAETAIRQMENHEHLRVRWGWDREQGRHAAENPRRNRNGNTKRGADTPPVKRPGQMPYSGPLRLQPKQHTAAGPRATSSALFFGAAVPGLPPSAGVDSKYAHLYS